MRVLFDTTALYVAAGVSGFTFTPRVQRLLEDSETVRMISPVSFSEIAIKANKGLTPLTREHIGDSSSTWTLPTKSLAQAFGCSL